MVWLDKTVKVSLSIINSLAALVMLMLLYSTLSRVFQADAKIMSIAFPFFSLLVFSLNVVSFWKYFGMIPSIIQILANLVLIPAFQLIIVLAIPFALAIINQMGIADRNEEVLKLMYISRGVSFLLLINCIYTLYRVLSARKQASSNQ